MNYHLTTAYFGKKTTLIPREKGEHRPIDEPDVPRICVAPTISGCLLALGPLLSRGDTVRVYATYAETIPAYDVLDSHITGECWVIKPAEFWLYAEFSICRGLDRLLARLTHLGADTGPQIENEIIVQRWERMFFGRGNK